VNGRSGGIDIEGLDMDDEGLSILFILLEISYADRRNASRVHEPEAGFRVDRFHGCLPGFHG